jgi:hypothetical protein
MDTTDKWMFNRKFKYSFSCIGESRAGSAILIKEEVAEEMGEIEWKNAHDGRTVSASFLWQGQRWTITSVYAPAVGGDREEYLEKLPELLEEEKTRPDDDNEAVVFGGDWNVLLDMKQDKRGGNPESGDTGADELINFMNFYDVEDIWRRLNPDKFETTWENSDGVASRLDRFLTSQERRDWVESVNHIDCPYSDHRAVQLILSVPNRVSMGRGSWAFNNSLLKDKRFCEVVKLELAKIDPQQADFVQTWEKTKAHLKRIARRFAAIKKDRDNREQTRLTSRRDELERCLKEAPNKRDKEELRAVRERIRTLIKDKVEGIRTRTREREIRYGAVPSKFFSNMEQSKREAQIIHALTDEVGEHTTTEGILDSATRFYQDLYGEVVEDEETESAQEDVLDCIRERVSGEDKLAVDCELTLKEVKEAMSRAGKGKSPGPDGLTTEFYQAFSEQIAPLLLVLYREVETRKSLPESQKDATIILLYKKGDRKDIRNYRPISLLNVDLKIVTKVLSTRLGKVLGTIVKENQSLVKGRYIHESVKVVLDMMHHLHSSKLKGLLLFLDQEKAFDRISWTYMKKIVKTFGFGPRFRGWLDLLYSDARATLKINNTMGIGFLIRRGVRQGDPLSPLLYVLAIEGLAAMVRVKKEHVGLDIPGGGSIKYLMYADDTTIFARDQKSIEAVKGILHTFEKASNARVNWKKSVGVNFGNVKIRADLWRGTWLGEHEVIKYLGVPITKDLNHALMWKKALQSIQTSFNSWRRQYMTMIGRKVIINAYVQPKITYLLQALPLDKGHKAVESMMSRFLWGGKKASISMATCYLPAQDGGLGVRDLRVTEKIMQIKWIQRYVAEKKDVPWRALAEFNLRNRAGDWGLTGKESLLCRIPQNKNLCAPFWESACKNWQDLGWNLDLQKLSKIQARNFPLWCNKWVSSTGDKRPFESLEYSTLASRGAIRIKDIYLDDGEATVEDLKTEYGEDDTVWWRVVTGIPDDLRRLSGGQSDEEEEEEEDEDTAICENLNLEGVKLGRLSNRHLYKVIRKKGFPAVEIKWQLEGMKIDWKRAWGKMWKSGTPNKWNQINFLALHRALWTGEKAKRLKWKGIPWECAECGVLETIPHLFWNCIRAREIRKEVGGDWRDVEEFMSTGCWRQRLTMWATWKSRCDDGREERGYCRERMKGEVEALRREQTKTEESKKAQD